MMKLRYAWLEKCVMQGHNDIDPSPDIIGVID
jgi:hypothetical protein